MHTTEWEQNSNKLRMILKSKIQQSHLSCSPPTSDASSVVSPASRPSDSTLSSWNCSKMLRILEDWILEAACFKLLSAILPLLSGRWLSRPIFPLGDTQWFHKGELTSTNMHVWTSRPINTKKKRSTENNTRRGSVKLFSVQCLIAPLEFYIENMFFPALLMFSISYI